MNITVFVVSHKPYWMPKDPVYQPIQVGPLNRNPLVGFLQDTTGDSIAKKNSSYCELTALYWVWKNFKNNDDYIGFCHYRRYFGKKSLLSLGGSRKRAIFTNQELDSLLAGIDVLLPKKRHYYIETIETQYGHAHNLKDLYITRDIIIEKYPHYIDSFDQYMRKRSGHICNMFIMRKQLFYRYSEWLFSILREAESRISIIRYDDYQRRVFGFLGERLLNVWLGQQNACIREVPVVELEPVSYVKKGLNFIERKFTHNF